MAAVFVSYSRSIAQSVAMLVNDLEALGHDVWIDRKLAGGQDWWAEILQAIRSCQVFIIALSPDTLTSTACASELEYAKALRRPTLPVLFVDMPPQKSHLLGLTAIQFVDYRKIDRSAGLSLARALTLLPSADPLPDPLPPPPRAPISESDPQRHSSSPQDSVLLVRMRLRRGSLGMLLGTALGVGLLLAYGAPDYWPLTGLLTGIGTATVSATLANGQRGEIAFVAVMTALASGIGYYSLRVAPDAAAVALVLFAPIAMVVASLAIIVRRTFRLAKVRDAA